MWSEADLIVGCYSYRMGITVEAAVERKHMFVGADAA
jgi:hypothetical protein